MTDHKKSGQRVLLVLLFFVLCTFLSRAADSITVPQVTLVHSERGSLTFQATGSGTIEAKDSRYLRFPEGLSIDRLYAELGGQVQKGQHLCRFWIRDVGKRLKSIQKEVNQLKLQLKEKDIETSPEQTAGDYDMAIANAKEDVKAAREDYKQSREDCQLAMNQDQEQVEKSKQTEYEKAEAAYRTLQTQQKKTEQAAKRVSEDAKEALEESQKGDQILRDSLAELLLLPDNDWTKKRALIDQIFQISFDNDNDKYENYLQQVASGSKAAAEAQAALQRAQEDYNNARYSDPDNLASYLAAVNAARKNVTDTIFTLTQLREKESKMEQYINQYLSLKKANKTAEADTALSKIEEALYGKLGLVNLHNKIDKLQKAYNRAMADEEELLTANKADCKTQESELEKLKQDLSAMQDGTYDYEEAAEQEEQAIKAMKQALLAAKRTYQKAVLQKKQWLQSQKSGQKAAQALTKLQKESLQLDIDEKQEAIKELQTLLDHNGYVDSPISGNVVSITLTAGKKSTAEDTIAVGKSGYEAVFLLPKDSGEYMEVHDPITLEFPGKSKTITAKIHSMQYITEEEIEKIRIKVTLPDQQYVLGAPLTMAHEKQSDTYDTLIPLSCLREDSKGTYVLTTQEKDGILGTELYAARIDVEAVAKSDTLAAIKGMVTAEDGIINSSSKDVAEGDRIRLQE